MSPSSISLSAGKLSREITLKNKATASFDPVFTITSNTSGLAENLEITNKVVTLLPNNGQSFGVRYTGGNVIITGDATLTGVW